MRFIEMADYNRSARLWWWTTALAGALVLVCAIADMRRLSNAELLGIALLTGVTLLAGMYPIRIPGTPAVITPSDIFIFLSALLFGTATATVVAAADVFAASCRGSKRWTSRLGSPATTAIAMLLSAQVFRLTLDSLNQWRQDNTSALLASMLVFALTHFLLTSLLLATTLALKQQTSVFRLWWANYSWAVLTYVASASAAGLIYLSIRQYGWGALLAAGPLVAVIFATCHFYSRQADEREKANRQRIEAAEEQARQAERHLQEMKLSEQRFHSAFDHAAIGMALVTPEGQWAQVNRSLCEIFGYAEAELLATNFQALIHPEDLEPVKRSLRHLLAGLETAIQAEHRYVHKLGHEILVSLSASVITDVETQQQRLIFQIQDVTARKQAEARLLHDAFHDGLTGLPNRVLFLDHLKLAMARAKRYQTRTYAVLFMDCDRFKIVNDSLGHLAGDELLVEIARRLEQTLRPGDTVARLGGDEFTMLLEDITDPEEALVVAERVQQGLKKPIRLNGTDIIVTASIGIAAGLASYQRPEEVLRDADTAMFQAKSLGRARTALFDQSMHARALTQLQVETDLHRAIERGELFVVYQPIVSLETARLAGFEALVRWRHPERGLVSPAEFIPVAEETGLILPVGEFVLNESCRQMKQWLAGLDQDSSLKVSVNLSGRQLAQDDVVGMVTRVLQRTGLDPRHLKLEITESVVMENIEQTIRTLEQLRALGISLSIDDFGTGYSSLSYLHRLPTDTLKVDRSFVIRMVENNENAEIVRTIITLARTLKMDVIAEGVETEAQLRQLQALGCQCGQGWLFSKPLEADAAGKLVRRGEEWTAFAVSSDQAALLQALTAQAGNYTM
ncbi:MAG TPA: EAL domain-containing protein [Blastocatellia bacterium]|nr:EAL domain-containing protein [Blastocatellia bacterium]